MGLGCVVDAVSFGPVIESGLCTRTWRSGLVCIRLSGTNDQGQCLHGLAIRRFVGPPECVVGSAFGCGKLDGFDD